MSGLSLAMLAGCGTTVSPSSSISSQVSSAQATATPAPKVTITGMVQNGMWNKGMDAVVVAADTKTGVKVDIQILPDGSQGEQVIKTKYASNDVTDLLFYWAGATIATLNPEKNFVDISQETWTANYPDVLKGPLTVNGKLLGAPLASSGIGLCGIFYNKKVFSDLKLEVPKTQTQFIEICEKVKATGNITPIFYSCKDAWSTQLIPMLGFVYAVKQEPKIGEKLSTNKLGFADMPIFVDSFDQLKKFRDKGYVNKDYLAATYDNAQKALVDGTAAMYPMGSWVMATMAEKFPDKMDNIGAFVYPYDDSGEPWLCVLGSGGVYINKSTKNLDAAKRWMAFYTSPEGASEYYKISKDIPVFNKVTADLFGATASLNEYMTAGKSSLVFTNLVPYEMVGFDSICVEVLVSGKSSLDEMKQVDINCRKDAKAKGVPGY